MDTLRENALPNASDRLALKTLVPALVESCRDMYEMACTIAREILKKYGVTDLEPEQVYWHRFHSAQSSAKTFTGWEHLYETPRESMTLPQLVIQRFSIHDQDNADLLDTGAGFYTAGPDAGTYNETNEVRLHSRDVLNEFWAINFADRYRNKVDSFWTKHGSTFRTLAKCTFLAKAIEDHEGGRLSNDNFRTAIKAIAGNVSWPVTRQMLEAEIPPADGLRVGLLKIGEFVATDIFCITDDKGGAILYVPGEIWGVHALQNARDLHWWVLSQIRKPSDRKRFMSHFQVADHDIMEDTSWRAVAKRRWLWALGPLTGAVSELWRAPHVENVGLNHVLDLLVSTWDSDDHSLVACTGNALTLDVFTFLRTAMHARMISDTEFMLHSNGDLRKKLWVGYFNAFNRMFGPMAAVGWPVALAVVGAGIANVGLQIDQAVNGKTSSARKTAVTGAIFAAIDTVFNATFLKGSGPLVEIAETETFIAPEEQLVETELSVKPDEAPIQSELSVKPDEKLAEAALARSPLPTLTDIAPEQVLPVAHEDFLASFKTEINEGTRIEAGNPKLQNIIQTASGKHYIYMRRAGTDGFYQVRYVEQMRGWVIIDPANPYSFYRNVPVRLNEALRWQPAARPGLKGGMKIFGDWPWGHTADPLPDVVMQVTPYEVPQSTREALRSVAQAETEDFPLDSLQSSDSLYQDFKHLRRGLYDDAIDFFSAPKSTSRPVMPAFKPETPFAEMTKRLFKNTSGLVVGQNNAAAGARGVLIDNMKALNKQKVRTLYVDHLLTDFHQTELDLFHQTGNMPPALQDYLTALDTRLGADLASPHTYTQLLKTAQKNHIRVQAIDCMASRRFAHMEHTTGVSSRKMKNYFSDTIIRADQAARGTHRWVALVDEGRASTFDKVAGLDELQGAVSLRVEDVPVGKYGVLSSDPGKKVLDLAGNPIDLIKSDLRLRVDAAPALTAVRTVEEALPRRGMFMLQKPSTLIHRSGDGTLVSTPVQQDAGGYFIVRPRWVSVSGRHFDSIHELTQALEHEGLTFRQVRIDPLAAEESAGIASSTPVAGKGTDATAELLLADSPLISSPYEIPTPLRSELGRTATVGDERTLGDAFVNLDGDRALDTFKMLRRQLRDAAQDYYAGLELPPRATLPVIDPAATAESFITQALERFNGLVIGESHADIGSKQWLIEQMPTLARKGVKTLYMEHLLTDFHQTALDNFARTSVMPRDLELYLQGMDSGHMTDPTQRFTFLNLVKEANRNGVRIQAIDCMASYRLEGMRGLESTARQKMMNFYAHTIIEADQFAREPHKWVALMGNSHANTYESVAGVSELENAVGLRIEDVGYGESRGWEPDPGRTFVNDNGTPSGQVQSDMRLQVQTPWIARTRPEIDQLLSRPGMYTLKKELRSTLLVHRGRDRTIVQTLIHCESGRYFIERPAWPTLHEKRFDSLLALLEALNGRGMTLAGWQGPL